MLKPGVFWARGGGRGGGREREEDEKEKEGEKTTTARKKEARDKKHRPQLSVSAPRPNKQTDQKGAPMKNTEQERERERERLRTVAKHVVELLLVVVEAVARRVVDAADVDDDVALIEHLLVPRADDRGVGVGRRASQERDAEGLVAVERAVVGADGGGGGSHG